MIVELSDHRGNVYSQNGEDGILAKVFHALGVLEGYFVEFGAWDGKHLSNTYALYEKGWRGCLIEADADRFRQLCRNVRDDRVTKLCRLVAISGADSLDVILDEVGAPRQIDLLSIDIDSDDLAVWRSIRRFRPTCVVVEYNPSIPFDCEFENPRGKNWGNSALSIYKFAGQEDYALLCVTLTNLIFVDRTPLASTGLHELRLDEAGCGPRWFWGYDGTLLCKTGTEEEPTDCEREIYGVPWARTVAIQPIPKVLRGFREDTSPTSRLRKALGLVVAVGLRPMSSARAAAAHLRKRSLERSLERGRFGSPLPGTAGQLGARASTTRDSLAR